MSKMMLPLVSVIIPCYNAERYVESAVRSILQQSYQNLEVLCINDGSRDSTFMILDKLSKEDDRVKVVNNESNYKLIGTLNRGIKLASGKYIARMDADDISDSSRIEKQVNIMENDDTYDVIGVLPVLIDRASNKLGLANEFNITTQVSIKFVSLFNSPIAHPSIIIKADLLKEFMYGSTSVVSHVEDYDLWARLLSKGRKIGVLSSPVFSYRINPSGVSISNRSEQAKNHISVSKKLMKDAGFESVEDRYIGIISKYFIPETFNEYREAINCFRQIKKEFMKRNLVSGNEKREINEWYSQRLIFIIFYAFKGGGLIVKVYSLLLLVLNIHILFTSVTYMNMITRIRLIRSK